MAGRKRRSFYPKASLMKLWRRKQLQSTIGMLFCTGFSVRADIIWGSWMWFAENVAHSIGLTRSSLIPPKTTLSLAHVAVKEKSKLHYHRGHHLHFGAFSLGFMLPPTISLPTFKISTLH